jgi:hypothetical protein
VLVSVIGGGLQIQPGNGPRDLALPQVRLFADSMPQVAPLPSDSWTLRLPPLGAARATPPPAAVARTPTVRMPPPTTIPDAIAVPQPTSSAEIAAASVARPTLSPSTVLLPGAVQLRPLTSIRPIFPRSERIAGSALTVELEFGLDRNGAIVGIQTVNAPVGADAFIASAQAALAKWRYAPEAAAQLAGERLRHRFEFRDQGAAIDDPQGCSMVTGSRICVVNGGSPEREAAVSPRDRRCETTTGTRLCRR